MLEKATAKLIKKLQQKKQRKKENLFVVEGEKIVREAMQSDFRINMAFATKEWLDDSGVLNSERSVFKEVDSKELKKISSLSSPQEVLAVLEIPKKSDVPISGNKLILALDRIQDPGNLGTIIRIADWFGISDVVCSEDCVDAFNPKVLQATMGSVFRVRVHYLNLEKWLKDQDADVYGALLGGKNLWQQELKKEGVLLMGNESSGISEELMKLVTIPVSIPSFGGAESLNVAVATAIICAEFSKLS